jgi:hypothetical protein
MRVSQIQVAINELTDVNSLDAIQRVLDDRRRHLIGATAGTYRIGDVVKMNARIRPAYLRDLTATVIAVNRTTVSVKCPVDARYGRFSGCPRVRLPLSLIAGKAAAHTPNNRGEDDGLGAERQVIAMEGRQR